MLVLMNMRAIFSSLSLFAKRSRSFSIENAIKKITVRVKDDGENFAKIQL